jgi:hypothetical protein
MDLACFPDWVVVHRLLHRLLVVGRRRHRLVACRRLQVLPMGMVVVRRRHRLAACRRLRFLLMDVGSRFRRHREMGVVILLPGLGEMVLRRHDRLCHLVDSEMVDDRRHCPWCLPG